jgi:hypothetical protein
MTEIYFVATEGDEPVRIYFHQIDAFVSGHEYIDSFDATGEKLNSYKFVNNEYITEF